MLITILTVAGFIFFVLAMLGCPSAPRFNLLAAGLACFALIQVLALKK